MLAAIDAGYTLYVNEIQRGNLEQDLVKETMALMQLGVSVYCEAEEKTIAVRDWIIDCTIEDWIAVAVTGISWAVAAYLLVVMEYTGQVWACWERFCKDCVDAVGLDRSAKIFHPIKAKKVSDWGEVGARVLGDIDAGMAFVFCLEDGSWQC